MDFLKWTSSNTRQPRLNSNWSLKKSPPIASYHSTLSSIYFRVSNPRLNGIIASWICRWTAHWHKPAPTNLSQSTVLYCVRSSTIFQRNTHGNQQKTFHPFSSFNLPTVFSLLLQAIFTPHRHETCYTDKAQQFIIRHHQMHYWLYSSHFKLFL